MKKEQLSDEEHAARERRHAAKLRIVAAEGELGNHGLTNVVQLILLHNADQHDKKANQLEIKKSEE